MLRARDEASRVIRQTGASMGTLSAAQKEAAMRNMAMGSSLVSVGTAIGAVGAAGTYLFVKATQSAIEYNRQAALTKTQLDGVHGSLQQIEQIGIRVAQTIPEPFDQMQTTLYDIFSSMDVNLPQAEMLLKSFSKSAVAGQVDLQSAARSTIAILNAYHMKAQQVNKVNDVMFQLVRKGVGTYDEFASVIGRVTPSAVRAGQSIRTVGGMMAFLTRNGLSAAMASSSAARALDALSNPVAVKALEKYGITMKNAKGEFLPMVDIIQQLHDKFQGLTDPQIAKKLHDLFLGAGGTIQARRFLDPAIKNIDEFRKRVGEMSKDNTAGIAQKKYEAMAKTPAAQAQLLSNQWKILEQQIGQALIPAFLTLVQALSAVVKWFLQLDPTVRKWIVIGLAITAVLLVIAGIVMVVVGGIIMLAAALTLAGVGLGAFILIIIAVVAFIALWAVAVFLIIKYHDQIWAFIVGIWNKIYAFVKGILMDIWHAIDGPVMMIVHAVVAYFTMLYQFWTTIWHAVWTIAKWIWNNVIQVVIGALKKVWNFLVPILKRIWEHWSSIFHSIAGTTRNVIRIIVDIIEIGAWLWYHWIKLIVTKIWQFIKAAWHVVATITKAAWALFKLLILGPAKATYDALAPIIQSIWDKGIKPTWDLIKTITRLTWNIIKHDILDPLGGILSGVIDFVGKVVDKIEWMGDKIQQATGAIAGFLDRINPWHHESPSLIERANSGWMQLRHDQKKHLNALYRDADRQGMYIRRALSGTVNANVTSNFQGTPQGSISQPHYLNTNQIQIDVHTQEIDPRKHASDLGWELLSRVKS